jgi:hypothetical protein
VVDLAVERGGVRPPACRVSGVFDELGSAEGLEDAERERIARSTERDVPVERRKDSNGASRGTVLPSASRAGLLHRAPGRRGERGQRRKDT